MRARSRPRRRLRRPSSMRSSRRWASCWSARIRSAAHLRRRCSKSGASSTRCSGRSRMLARRAEGPGSRVEPSSAASVASSDATAKDAGPFLTRPAVTGLVAIAAAAAAFASYSQASHAALAAFVAAVLVVVSVTDLERRIIPNVIVLPATLIALAAHLAIEPGRTVELVVAPLTAGAFLFAPNLFASSAIGMGDVKLALLLGVTLGWGVVGALLIGFIATAPFSLAILIRGGRAARKATLPLGPFLAFGGLVVLIAPRL